MLINGERCVLSEKENDGLRYYHVEFLDQPYVDGAGEWSQEAIDNALMALRLHEEG